jgi:hypothetical protein
MRIPRAVAYLAVLLPGAMLCGCASPGSPQPPSLHLPRPVSDLKAQRVGDSVQLSWTMAGDTTDGLALEGQRKVKVCRRVGVGVCAPVQSFAEMPKAKITIEDILPPALVKSLPELLAYEVEVMNLAGRSAGASNPAYTASGSSPDPVSGLQAVVTERGVVLHWEQASDTGSEMLLRRERIQTAPVAKKSAGPVNPLAPQSAPDVQMLRVHADAGGTVDASVVLGEQYAYKVQRVNRLVLVGQSVELRSEPSVAVNVDVRDTFPPQAPQGLAAAEPMRAADGSLAIDLSWEANAEPDLAGYFIYRRDMSAEATRGVRSWAAIGARLNAQILPAPAFHDTAILAGHTYEYSVTAVDKSGNQSNRSAVITETVPQ